MKKLSFLFFSLLVSMTISAQEIFGDAPTKLLSEVKRNWIPILVIYTLIFAIFNLKHFHGESADSKKGVTAIIIYVGSILVSIAVIKYVESVSL